MANMMENRSISAEQLAHELAMQVVSTSIQGYQLGNDYQISDADMARVAFNVYSECFPLIQGLIEKG